MHDAAVQRECDFMEAMRAREQKARAEAYELEADALIAQPMIKLGKKHFADRLGLPVSKQDRVYHWVERRGHQRPPAELLLHALDEMTEEQFQDFCEKRGYERPRRKLPTDADRLARAYEERLRAFGEKGLDAIREAREEASRPTPKDWESSGKRGSP